MLKYINYQENYTKFQAPRQLVLPMDYGMMIPDDEPVRLLDAVLEELDYTELLHLYSSKGRKSAVAPTILFKIIVMAMMDGIYSLRGIQRQCRVNIQYMWLLQGHQAPSHMAFGRFIQRMPVSVWENLFAQFIDVLSHIDSLSFDHIFVDGTKLEAQANRYTFVWRKNVERALVVANQRQDMLRQQVAAATEIDTTGMNDDELLSLLYKECRERHIPFVHGSGHRKEPLQRLFEACAENRKKRLTNETHLAILGERNSYSKTDHDATFMRMKEDHMRNGQLKPAYNLQLAVASEYVVGVGVFPNPTDTKTLIPFLREMDRIHGRKFRQVVADAGYDSEENYAWLEQHGYESVIKPSQYEARKKKSRKKYIGLAENMDYDENHDEYVCAKGRRLRFVYWTTQKSKTGYRRDTKVYECTHCDHCGKRRQCQRNRTGCMPKRPKRIYVSPEYERLQQDNAARFASEVGTQLRMNRSIQSEGAFAVIKSDFSYKRVLRRGKMSVYKEILLILFGFNLRKLHNRIQEKRIGKELFAVKKAV